jgi:ketosteroid isomerase-like protein
MNLKNARAGLYALLLTLPLSIFAQTDFKNLVDAEKGFSQLSVEQNTQLAFMKYLADDALVFAKGLPVNGKERWAAIKPDSSKLSWYPAFADVATSGEMGFTTGPWEYRETNADKDAAAFGNYITIWKKQADGSWKAAIDLGISHPKPATADAQATAPMTPPTKEHSSATDLTAAETNFIATTANAYQKNSSSAVKIFWPGQAYLTAQAADAGKADFTFTQAGNEIAKSGELGYVYGAAIVKRGDKTLNGSYLRIWKLHNKKWELNIEVVSLQ